MRGFPSFGRLIQGGSPTGFSGGDAFAILLESVSTPEEVITAVQRIQASLALPYESKGKSIDSGASIGVVINLTLKSRLRHIQGRGILLVQRGLPGKDIGQDLPAEETDGLDLAPVKNP